jgi:flagellar biosynthesis protein FliQ
MFTWLTESQITDTVQSKSKLKKNTDVPKVYVYHVLQNVKLVLLLLTIVNLVLLEESILQLVNVHQVNTLTLTSCVNLVIQNVKLVLIMPYVLNVLMILTENSQKNVHV